MILGELAHGLLDLLPLLKMKKLIGVRRRGDVVEKQVVHDLSLGRLSVAAMLIDGVGADDLPQPAEKLATASLEHVDPPRHVDHRFLADVGCVELVRRRLGRFANGENPEVDVGHPEETVERLRPTVSGGVDDRRQPGAVARPSEIGLPAHGHSPHPFG